MNPRIFTTWTACAEVFGHTAAREVHQLIVFVVGYVYERIESTVLVDGAEVAHGPVQRLAGVKSVHDHLGTGSVFASFEAVEL